MSDFPILEKVSPVAFHSKIEFKFTNKISLNASSPIPLYDLGVFSNCLP